MKIYTKTGDDGETGLFGGTRVSKADPRVEAYGAVDELNSVLGIVGAVCRLSEVQPLLNTIQSELFDIGAELAAAPDKAERVSVPMVDEAAVARLEAAIDVSEEQLDPLATFIVPGGTEVAAYLHLARTTCRRAERRVVALGVTDALRGEVIRYLNRLSDLLFSWARLANRSEGKADVPWRGRDRT